MVSVILYPCILCVALLMVLFVLCLACLTVFVNHLVKQFAICLGVGGGVLLDRPYMLFQRMCVFCM